MNIVDLSHIREWLGGAVRSLYLACVVCMVLSGAWSWVVGDIRPLVFGSSLALIVLCTYFLLHTEEIQRDALRSAAWMRGVPLFTRLYAYYASKQFIWWTRVTAVAGLAFGALLLYWLARDFLAAHGVVR